MHALSRVLFVMACAVISTQTVALAESIGTAFTYQGKLKADGIPADGNYGFRFQLFRGPDGTFPVGDPVLLNVVPVSRYLHGRCPLAGGERATACAGPVHHTLTAATTYRNAVRSIRTQRCK